MSRPREAPLVDPARDPRRAVGLKCAAAFLGVHAQTLRGRIEAGLLPAYRDGKVYRITVAALRRYQRTPPETER
jgi:excisionase family DNA binding protein